MAQKKDKHINSVGVSIPLILNSSNGVYYSLGNKREPSGKAFSYGINLNYSHFVYKNIYLIGGIGYFKQRFNIRRPFNYVTPDMSKPLVSTRGYFYHNIHLYGGLGYQKKISQKWELGGHLSYNIYQSFKQRYKQDYAPGINERYKNNILIGSMLNLDIKCIQHLNDKFSIGAAIILPINTNWNNDSTFINSPWGYDSITIAKSKFSVGTSFSIYYKFKN